MNKKTKKYLLATGVCAAGITAAYLCPALLPTIKIATFAAASQIINRP